MFARVGDYIRHHHLGLLALFVALGGTSYATLKASDSDAVRACVDKKTGETRIVGTKKCKADEKLVTWSEQGPEGPPGAQGAPGPTGPAGTGVTLEAWHNIGAPGEPAFLTGWGPVNANYVSSGFRKDSNGVVYLKGSFAKTAGAWDGSPLFTLPAGYRPTKIVRVAIFGENGAYAAALQIQTDGTVIPLPACCQGSSGSMDGASFQTGTN